MAKLRLVAWVVTALVALTSSAFAQGRDAARITFFIWAGSNQGVVPTRVIEAYLEEKTYRAIFTEMGALGLIGVTIPEKYGCAGANYVSYGLVAREIERVD